MVQRDTPDIRVLVGVTSDTSIDSGSGQLIADTLKTIATNISSNASKIPKVTFAVDISSTTSKIEDQLKTIVRGVKVEPLDLNIRTNQSSIGTSTRGSGKGTWDGVFKQSLKDLTAKNVDLNPLNNYYKDLEKQGDAFHKKNLNGIDVEIKAREAQGKAFSAQIKDQMQQRENEIKSFMSEASKLNNAEKSINTSKNFANKLGKSELSDGILKLRKKIGGLNAEVANLKTLLENTEKGSSLQNVISDEGLKELTSRLKKANDEVANLQALATKESPLFVKNERLADQARDISAFSLSLDNFAKKNDKFKGNSGAAAEFERIKQALADIERRSNLGETVGVDLKNLIADTNRWKSHLEAAGLSGQTVFGKLRTQMEKLGVYLSASAIMMGAWRQVKQMTTNVIELDNSLNSLQMVTGYSNSQMQSLLETYQGLASELSATTSEVLAGSEVWLRQGRSISETNELIKTSTVFSKVAMIDAATASDLLTSSINGYGVAAKDAMSIVDALAAVDMSAATSSEEMAQAMQKTAASAKLAGVPMNELIAYIATISETSRASAEVVGTAMKSLFSRITQVKAGKLVDDDGEDISNVSKVLTQYGVAVQNTNGTLRDANVIISDLANTWGKLTNAEQQEVAGAVAGLRQKEQFTILMENWERVTKLATVATNSNGYALEKFNIHQESTAAKMAEFQNQYQILSAAIMDSGLIKGTIDTGTGFLGGLTWIIDKLGTIPTLATVAAGALSLISNKGGYAPLIKAA